MPPIIDPEVSSFWPPLSDSEFADLANDLKANGCLSPLVAWQGILLDGHHRLKICQESKIGYKVQNLDLPDRNAALQWVIRHQTGRRNITGGQRAMMGATLAELLKAAGKARRAENLKKGEDSPKVSFDTIGNSNAAAAAQVKVSPAQVARAATVLVSGDEALIAEVRQGKKSVGQAVKEIDTKPKPDPIAGPVDQLGNPLPAKQSIQQAFARLGEVKGLQREVSTLKGKLIEAAARSKDPIFARFDVSAAKADMEHVFQLLKAIAPHAVCPYCAGGERGGADNCAACKGLGWLDYYLYQAAPRELK